MEIDKKNFWTQNSLLPINVTRTLLASTSLDISEGPFRNTAIIIKAYKSIESLIRNTTIFVL